MSFAVGMIHTAWDLTVTTTHQTLPGQWQAPVGHGGSGFTVEGTLASIRNHNVEDSSRRHFRFMALTVNVTKARKREFDAKGEVGCYSVVMCEVVLTKGYLVGARDSVPGGGIGAEGLLERVRPRKAEGSFRVGNHIISITNVS
jgi:hypothetical protein